MSTPTLESSVGTAPESRLPFGGLVRAELRRLRLRRLVLLLTAVYFLCLGAATVYNFAGYSSNDPAALQQAYDRGIGLCEDNFGSAIAVDPEDQGDFVEEPFDCRAQVGTPENYAVNSREIYSVVDQLGDGITGTAATFAVLAFLLGATSIGADWSAKTLPGALTWEPRRLRLLLGRLAALLGAVTGAAILAQGVHLLGAVAMARYRGTYTGVAQVVEFWPGAYAQMGRGVLLAGFFATAGFAIAVLLRSTAAALGVAFAYLTLGEILLRGVRPSLTPWLVSHNLDAWMSRGGADVTYFAETQTRTGEFEYQDITVHLSTQRGGAYLLLGCLAMLLIAGVFFRRRDIT